MFTGIITKLGTISAIESRTGDQQITVAADYSDIKLGDSIAVNGVCLTVIDFNAKQFTVDVSKETLRCSALNQLNINDKVNLEQSIKASDRLDGHWVTGHVDATSQIISIKQAGQSHELNCQIPTGLAKYIAGKGSVTLDGISLTVNQVTHTSFTVNIIPHTWQATTLHTKKTGDHLNLEVDIVARYIERLAQYQQTGISKDYLTQKGFA